MIVICYGVILKMIFSRFCYRNFLVSLGTTTLMYENPIENIYQYFGQSNIELFNFMDTIRENPNKLPIIYLDVLNDFLREIGEEEVDHVNGYELK